MARGVFPWRAPDRVDAYACADTSTDTYARAYSRAYARAQSVCANGGIRPVKAGPRNTRVAHESHSAERRLIMSGHTPWAMVKKKAAAKRAQALANAPRFLVRAYGRQVWIGRDEKAANALVEEYNTYLEAGATVARFNAVKC